MERIESGLYWQLPAPRNFIRKVATALTSKRGVFINMPRLISPIIHAAIEESLKHTNIHGNPVSLIVRSGTNIASDLGVHFQQTRISGGQLADLEAPVNTAVILTAADPAAQQHCEDFASDFIKATEHAEGNIQLIVKIQNDDFLNEQSSAYLTIIPFDGGLKREEMEAYVNLRMIDRDGPQDTRLYRAIVSEFAGFDPYLAERLMTLDDNHIIYIRNYLQPIMEENLDRWRHDSWIQGTHSIVSSNTHTLRDVYLMHHGTAEEQGQAKKRLDKRYWLACLREITPWLETNRHKVFRPLMPIIKQYANNNSLPIPAGNKTISVDLEDLEYGNVSGLIGKNKIYLLHSVERNALYACKSAKIIRDEISHLRAPTSDMVTKVFSDITACIK